MLDNLPPELERLYQESMKAQEQVRHHERKLRKARKHAKEAHETFDNALQEHLGQMTLFGEQDE